MLKEYSLSNTAMNDISGGACTASKLVVPHNMLCQKHVMLEK